MIKRLRAKFVCITMALVTVLLVALLILVYHFTAVNLESDSITALKAAGGGKPGPGRPGEGMIPCFVLEEGPDGQLMVSGNHYFDLSDGELIAELYDLARNQKNEIGVLEDYALRYYRHTGRFGVHYAFMDISAERATLKNLMGICLAILGAGFVAFLGISILLARWAIRPVEQAFEQQKQFVADASHELKTPLTVILTNAEMLQSAEYSAADKGKFAESILDVSRQMRGLVESLLQLARADQGRQKQILSRLDISALVENAVLPFEPVYFESGLILESQIEPGLQAMADATTLRQVVDILLDNGRKYSTPGAAAVMTLRRQGKRIQLRFFTPGKPMTAQQCRDIFKRFYRLDEARTPGGSYGLGLSIAQNIIAAHGGRIWAEGAHGGNVFTVTLPEA